MTTEQARSILTAYLDETDREDWDPDEYAAEVAQYVDPQSDDEIDQAILLLANGVNP